MNTSSNNEEMLYKKYEEMKIRWVFAFLIVSVLSIMFAGLAGLIIPNSLIIWVLCLAPILMGLIVIIISLHYSRKQNQTKIIEYDKRSGRGELSEVPKEIKRWSWGAFVFGWIWGVYHGVWLSLLTLVPFVGLIIAIILGVKGNGWAWRSMKWRDVYHFNGVQKKWNLFAITFLVFLVSVSIMSAFIN